MNVRLFVVIFTAAGISAKDSRTQQQPTTNNYLGAVESKIFYFPWLVTFHWVKDNLKEFFGSGSIVSEEWVLTSMNSFVRKSSGGKGNNYYLEVNNIHVVVGSIWAEYAQGNIPAWMQTRKIENIQMFSKTNKTLVFTKSSIPQELNTVDRSPLGFSKAIALVKLAGKIVWKRNMLPIPVHYGSRGYGDVQDTLRKEFDFLEAVPYPLTCYVGGWRNKDKRLVRHEVVYVPFDQCREIFCSNDRRACLKWPVQNVHVCFKSVTFTDLCWRDQGSALYCEQFLDSVVAILTTAPTCGYKGLPGVYTRVGYGLQLLESQQLRYHEISKDDLHNKYGPPKESELILHT